MKTAQDVLDAHAIQPHFRRSGEQILGLLQEMEPRTVTTVEDLNNLPVGAVLKGIGELDIVTKTASNYFYVMSHKDMFRTHTVASFYLPALVIWEPQP